MKEKHKLSYRWEKFFFIKKKREREKDKELFAEGKIEKLRL